MEQIRYVDYPEGKRLTPFQPLDGDSYFMVTGHSFTYLGSYEEIGNIQDPWEERSQRVQGDRVLCIFKRYAVIQQGRVAYTNPHFDDGHKIGRSRLEEVRFAILTDRIQEYHVDSWGEKKFRCFSIRDDSGAFNAALQYKLFDSAEEAVQYAIRISAEQSMTCIVAQWFADLDRY